MHKPNENREMQDREGTLDRTAGRPSTSEKPIPPHTKGEEDAEADSEDWGSPRIIHRVIPAASLDRDATAVVRRLSRKGHTAYLVGGCVRDLLLGRRPKDFDIGTSARPRQVKRVFRNCRVIGRRFRLAHIIFGEKIIEVSTFRQGSSDPAPTDDGDDLLIRDDNVFGTPREDARRRDFTINGLFYDLQQSTVIDYVGGLHDLERKTVRTIGDPDIRFQEDPIRILRAIKFAARLALNISPKTREALERHREKIQRSAPPRVLEELLRMARGASARRSFELMDEAGVLEVVLPAVAEGLEEVPERRSLYRRCLDDLDARVERGLDPTAPIVFGTLLLPLVFPESSGALDETSGRPDGPGTETRIEAVLSDLIPRLRLSRRDAGRLRQILMAQRRLSATARKRRFSRASVARQAYFPEALTLFEIHCTALDRNLDEAERWRAAFERLPKPPAPQGAMRQRGGARDAKGAQEHPPGAGKRGRSKRRSKRRSRRKRPAPPQG